MKNNNSINVFKKNQKKLKIKEKNIEQKNININNINLITPKSKKISLDTDNSLQKILIQVKNISPQKLMGQKIYQSRKNFLRFYPG